MVIRKLREGHGRKDMVRLGWDELREAFERRRPSQSFETTDPDARTVHVATFGSSSSKLNFSHFTVLKISCDHRCALKETFKTVE